MKDKVKMQDLTLRDSDSYEKFNAPDYPDYPDCDDIYNIYLERKEIDPKNIFKIKACPHRSKKHESIHKSY